MLKKKSGSISVGKTAVLKVHYNSTNNLLEQPGYFEVPGAHLYTVLHRVVDPVARVLLTGSFARERDLSYLHWTRWARYLASKGVECLKYDYRGTGESTGLFEEMTFENWLEDVDLLAGWLKRRSPHVPLVVHGLELGALLAAKIFEKGVGNGLLLWAPPASANHALRTSLLREIAINNAFKYGAERKELSDYIRQLELGTLVDVVGYRWSARLWRDSLNFHLPPGLDDAVQAAALYKRPIKIVKQDKLRAPLVRGSPVSYEFVNRDSSELFADNFQWISTLKQLSREEQI